MFVIAQFINGLGSVAYYTVGLTYVEDSCPSGKGALYFGIVRMCSAIGPIFGYVGGALALSQWVDFDEVDPDTITIDTSDSQWVGAWWIGILFAGIASLIFAIPFFPFSRQLPGVAQIKKDRVDETLTNVSAVDMTMWQSMKILFKNPVFLCGSLGTAFDSYIKTGLMNLGPKIIETRFQVTASRAAITSGVVCVPGAILGSIFGGVIILVFKLTGRGIMIFSTISACLAATFYGTALYFTCGTVTMVGITQPYPTDVGFYDSVIGNVDLNNACNEPCHCTTEFTDPVCLDGLTYFSPCHAGCTSFDNDTEIFENCACGAITQTAYKGECKKTDEEEKYCDGQLSWMLGVTFFTIFFEFLTDTTVPIAILRAVNPELKGLSMGCFWLIVKVIGSIPSPIILGAFLDFACLVWQDAGCDDEGFCWIYDDHLVFVGSISFPLIMKGVNCVFYGLGAYYFTTSMQNKEPEKTEEISSDKKSLSDTTSL